MNNFIYYVYNDINNCVYSLDLLSETVTKSLDFGLMLILDIIFPWNI